MSQQERLTVDLLGYRAALEAFAEQTHRTTSGVIRYFIEQGLKREAPELLNLNSSNEEGSEVLPAKFLKTLADGDLPRNDELTELAHQLDIPVEVLLSIRDKYLGEVERDAENSES